MSPTIGHPSRSSSWPASGTLTACITTPPTSSTRWASNSGSGFEPTLSTSTPALCRSMTAPTSHYDGLIVATGASARSLPGTEGVPGVRTLRTLDDAEGLIADLAAAGPGARVVVIGAGFIGSEVAATCRGLGFDVTVVEALPHAARGGPRRSDGCGLCRVCMPMPAWPFGPVWAWTGWWPTGRGHRRSGSGQPRSRCTWTTARCSGPTWWWWGSA